MENSEGLDTRPLRRGLEAPWWGSGMIGGEDVYGGREGAVPEGSLLLRSGGKRILIVEDELLIALNIATVLNQSGYEVIGIAGTMADAVRLASERTPDLVLMDVTLEGRGDGVETARQLQNRFATPILFVTAHSDRSTLERVRALNPRGWLLKPFSPKQLEQAVEAAFGTV